MRRRIREILDFSKSSQAITVLVVELVFGLVAVLGSLYVFLELADEVLEKEAIFFDSIISGIIVSFRSPPLTDVMIGLSFLGGNYFLGLAIITTIILLWKKHRKDAIMFGFIFLSGVGLNLILKEIFQRPRPEESLIVESLYSFPSGHAMNSFVFYAALTYFVFWHMKNRKLGWILSIGAGVLIFAIGISRIYLGVHYASDVIAGFFAGLCWMGVVILLEKTLLFFRLFRVYETDKKY